MNWNVDPEIFRIGSFAVRWYGLMFVIGFLIGERYAVWAYKRKGLEEKDVSKLVTYVLLGTILGARLGHCLFYEPDYYLSNPLSILKIWEGGLASHGGYLGIFLTIYLYMKAMKGKMNFLWLMDMVAAPALLTGAFIRLGNLMNSEILGRPADVPWAMVFKKVDNISRHPTQIYEALGYLSSAVLLAILFKKYDGKWAEGRVWGVSLMYSFVFRFFVEFFKENQTSFENGLVLNMGQFLSIPFVAFGLYLFLRKPRHL